MQKTNDDLTVKVNTKTSGPFSCSMNTITRGSKQACNEMTRLAMKNRYDDPFEAIAAVFQIMAEWGLLLLTGPIIGTALVGAFVSGIMTEYAWRTWR